MPEVLRMLSSVTEPWSFPEEKERTGASLEPLMVTTTVCVSEAPCSSVTTTSNDSVNESPTAKYSISPSLTEYDHSNWSFP